MTDILIVEDEGKIVDILRMTLEEHGHRVEAAATLDEARRRVAERQWDAVLLDLTLPDGDGTSLCREIRAHSTVPVLILTARSTELDRILGLELGADDYIVKPFSPREVVARLSAVLRRQSWEQAADDDPTVLRWHELEVDSSRRQARAAGRMLSLTRTEFRLLETLTRRPGHVFSRDQLIDLVWDGAFIQGRVVDSVVSRLRRKLGAREDGSPSIRTVHGVGYALDG